MFLRGLYRNSDGGGAGGEPPATTTTGDGTGAPGNQAPNAGQGQQVQFTAEQQSAIDRIIAERLTRAKAKWETDATAEADKAKAEAEKTRLKEQAEWQKLAETHEARVKELEPLEVQVKAYADAVEALLAARVKELGEQAKTAVEALPGTPGPLDKLNWLTANEALFKPAAGNGVGTPGRSKPKPPTTGVVPVVESGQTTERKWVSF
jgi:hypothetical protein